ncbi:uncharacterized protein LOC127255207 [Andrographis paniculata]|uniref:uncharacterized protein LOC127255207 n=1 Tax=Andrographis paniculata TaxID=175694 RepID=UPI0021E789AD|nr:uncharacterized protein LOC127255207 [Andrographis paniculata]
MTGEVSVLVIGRKVRPMHRKIQTRPRLFPPSSGCAAALEEEDKFPKDTNEEVNKEILTMAHSAILLSVTDEVLREVVDQTTSFELWINCVRSTKTTLSRTDYIRRNLFTPSGCPKVLSMWTFFE